MELTLWTYEGPPHVGAMRIAASMEGVHYVLHAPQGDTYADLLFTMIERLPRRPPVTYTTFQARDLGGDTAELFKTAVKDAYDRFAPKAMLVGASCTAELIQDDPGGLAQALNLPIPVVGAYYWVKNQTTGVLKVYSVGATINGTTGTTAISISATGTLTAGFGCSTAGAWQVVPAAT